MGGLLRTIENHVAVLNPTLLLALALVIFVAGLFVWLGGIGYKRTLFIIVGAFCGMAFAASIRSINTMLFIALIGIGILLALKMNELFLAVLVSVLVAIYGFSSLIRPYVDNSKELIIVIRQLTIEVPYYNWPMLLCLIVAPLAAGTAWWQGTSAALLSATGTVMLFSSAFMISICSGFDAVVHIVGRSEIYIGLFIAVTAVGAILQMLLLPRISSRVAAARETAMLKAKRVKRSKKHGDDEPEKVSMASWRTS